MSEHDEPIHEADLRTALRILADLYGKVDGKIDRCIDGLAEVRESQKIDSLTGQRTYEETKRTNGRLLALETWQRDHVDLHLEEDGEEKAAASYVAGRESVRDEQRAMVMRAVHWLWGKWPVALVAVLAGFGARVGAWFIREGWTP